MFNLQKTVPFIASTFLNSDKENFINLSKINSNLNKNTKTEGIVIRSVYPIIDKDTNNYAKGTSGGCMFSFKVINPEFLLKYDL